MRFRLGAPAFWASGSEGIADPTDRESVSLGGASPLSPTIFVELKPQQTGTRLLIGYGEVATTSGSTSLRHLCSGWRRLPRRSTGVRRRAFITCRASAWQATFLPGRLISRTPPFEGGHVGANPAPAANFGTSNFDRSVVKQDHGWPTPSNRRGRTFPSDQFAAECGSLHTCL